MFEDLNAILKERKIAAEFVDEETAHERTLFQLEEPECTQQLRKDADLEIESRIRICYSSTDANVAGMLGEWSELIRTETLADSLTSAASPPASVQPVNVGDAKVRVWIEQV